MIFSVFTVPSLETTSCSEDLLMKIKRVAFIFDCLKEDNKKSEAESWPTQTGIFVSLRN